MAEGVNPMIENNNGLLPTGDKSRQPRGGVEQARRDMGINDMGLKINEAWPVGENRPFKQMSYQELTQQLFSSNAPETQRELRNERQARWNEIQKDGYYPFRARDFTDLVDRTLRATDSENFPLDLTRLARNAEDEARGRRGYLGNQRLEGVVGDVIYDEVQTVISDIMDTMTDAELSARRTSRSQLGQVRDRLLASRTPLVNINMPGAKLQAEPTDEELSAYASTVRGGDAILRRREMSRAARAAASGAPVNPGTRPNLGNSIEPAVWPNLGLFGEEFMRKRGVNVMEYEQPTYSGTLRIDVPGTVELMFKNSSVPFWADANRVEGTGFAKLFEDEGGYEVFARGVAPWIQMWYVDGGSYSALADPATKQGLIDNVSLFYTAKAFEHDDEFKRCLAISFEMNGATRGPRGKRVVDIPNAAISRDDKRFAQVEERGFDAEMKKGHLDVTAGLQESRAWAKAQAERIARHVGCDIGTAIVAIEMATVLAGSPKMLEYRKMENKYPFLSVDPDEKIALPLLAQTFVGTDSTRGNRAVFLVDFLNSGGIDSLFDAMANRLNPARLKQAIYARARVLQYTELVEFYHTGDDSFTGKNATAERIAARNKAISAMVDEKAVPDVTNGTIAAMKDWGVYSGRGKHASAGSDWKEREQTDWNMIMDDLFPWRK